MAKQITKGTDREKARHREKARQILEYIITIIVGVFAFMISNVILQSIFQSCVYPPTNSISYILIVYAFIAAIVFISVVYYILYRYFYYSYKFSFIAFIIWLILFFYTIFGLVCYV